MLSTKEARKIKDFVNQIIFDDNIMTIEEVQTMVIVPQTYYKQRENYTILAVQSGYGTILVRITWDEDDELQVLEAHEVSWPIPGGNLPDE